jgi:hypothetical protein
VVHSSGGDARDQDRGLIPMPRKSRSNIDIVTDIVRHADRQREATRAWERRRMNELAARGLLNNAAVLERGITENAARGSFRSSLPKVASAEGGGDDQALAAQAAGAH